MGSRPNRLHGWALLTVALISPHGCAVSSGSPTEPKGPVPQAVLRDHPDWRARYDQAPVDDAKVRRLSTVPKGAQLSIVFGAWCPDSLQHVPVMWKALAQAAPPIEVHNVSVDRSKTLPPGLDPKIDDLRYVPTLVVHRDGVEVGRVVESAPHGVVEDVLRLLTGKTRGVVSGRSDL